MFCRAMRTATNRSKICFVGPCGQLKTFQKCVKGNWLSGSPTNQPTNQPTLNPYRLSTNKHSVTETILRFLAQALAEV